MSNAVVRLPMLAGMFGGWEIVMVLAIVLLLFGAKYLPPFVNGLQRGVREFKKATDDVAHDLGESVGGIAGRPVADALTISNQTSEDTAYPSFDFDAWVKTSWNKFIVWIAQGFGIGRIPFAPGTWGSVLGLAWTFFLAATSFPLMFFAIFFGLIAALPICGKAEKALGQRDPSSVVLDEIVAVPICMLTFWSWMAGVPASTIYGQPTWPESVYVHPWAWLAFAFALFRLFDIWKPWPIRQSQRLPGGWGIVMDDVLAAVYVNLVMLAAFWLLGR